jgi:hypothetical protein
MNIIRRLELWSSFSQHVSIFSIFSYCMCINLRWIPEDWICESCLSNNLVSPEVGRNKDIVRTMPLDPPDVVCNVSMHTSGPSSRGQAYPRRQKPVETGKVKFIPTEEVIRLSSGATGKGNLLRLKLYHSVRPSGLVKFPSHGGVRSMPNQQTPQALKKLEGDNSALFHSMKSRSTSATLSLSILILFFEYSTFTVVVVC